MQCADQKSNHDKHAEKQQHIRFDTLLEDKTANKTMEHNLEPVQVSIFVLERKSSDVNFPGASLFKLDCSC